MERHKNKNVSVIAIQTTEEAIRSGSSSGGVFPLIAKDVLRDGGTVYGAAFTPEFSIHHIRVANESGISALQGSKYAFDNLGTSYRDCKNDLEEGKRVLFTGTPCQIAGLRSFLKKDYENLFVMDFICHGTPSLATWNKYLKELSSGKKIAWVSFRDKRNGWYGYNTTVKFDDGTEYSVNHNDDLYMRAFLSETSLRGCCFNCQFKGVDTRESDITLGDLWGAKELAPELYDDKGTSLLIISTDKGRQMIRKLGNLVETAEVDANKAFEINWAAIKSAEPSIYKPLFDKVMNEHKGVIPFFKSIFEPTKVQKVRNKLYRIYRKKIAKDYPDKVY